MAQSEPNPPREPLLPLGRQRSHRLWVLGAASRSVGALLDRTHATKVSIDSLLNVERYHEDRPDDVFVVSYPKSGTTLLQMLLYQLTTDGAMTFDHILEVQSYFDELMMMGDPRELTHLARRPAPRVFKCHYRAWRVPRAAKKIYVVRHPSDVALALSHHHQLMGDEENRYSHLERFVDGDDRGFGSWYKHVRSWWPHRENPSVLFVRFEDVTRDLAGAARQVAAFCGLPLAEDQLPRIVERCGIAFMKAHTKRFDPRFHRPLPFEQLEHGGDFINVGRSGRGVAALAPGQRARLARRLKTLARELAVGDGDPWSDLFRLP
jgi:Sulfotransferase domain